MLPFDFHSPIERLHLPAFNENQIEVHIKRDDLIHPFISGNKWRKLKYSLEEALALEKSHLVTFGGAWSNHLVATACAGAKFGFRATGFVRGEEVSNPVLKLCKLFGMDLHFVSREAYRDKHQLYENFPKTHESTYFVDEGGRSKLGLLGCTGIIEELAENYDHIFCACGTGTTVAGLATGVLRKGLQTKVHGVPVLKNGDFLYEDIQLLNPEINRSRVTLHTEYHFGGYARSTNELDKFIANFCAQTGILIEPVYTGKLLFAVENLIREHYFPSGSRVLVIHTGGLTGILGNLLSNT